MLREHKSICHLPVKNLFSNLSNDYMQTTIYPTCCSTLFGEECLICVQNNAIWKILQSDQQKMKQTGSHTVTKAEVNNLIEQHLPDEQNMHDSL